MFDSSLALGSDSLMEELESDFGMPERMSAGSLTQRWLKRLERSAFNSMYAVVSKTSSFSIVSILVLVIEVLQLASFAFHESFSWGPAAGDVVNPVVDAFALQFLLIDSISALRIITLATYALFLLAGADAAYVGYVSSTESGQPKIWLLRCLRYAVGFAVTVLYIPIMVVLLTPFRCKYSASPPVLADYPSVECWDPEIMVYRAFGGVFAILLLLSTTALSLVYFQDALASPHLLARAHSRVDCGIHFSKSLLLIASILAADLPGILGGIMVFSMFAVYVAQVLFMAIYHPIVQYARTGGFAVLSWFAAMALLSTVSYSSPETADDTLFIVTMVLAPLVFVAGVAIAYLRMLRLARKHALPSRVHPNNNNNNIPDATSNPALAATTGTLTSPMVGTHFADASMTAPPVVPPPRTRFWLVTDVELVARIYQTAGNVDGAMAIFHAGFDQFPNSVFLLLCYVRYLSILGQTAMAQAYLDRSMQLPALFDLRFARYQKVQDVEKAQAAAGLTAGGAMDLVSYVQYQSKLQSAKAAHILSVRRIASFWRTLLSSDVTFLAKSATLITHIDEAERQASAQYRNLVSKYPKAPSLLEAYAQFLDQVSNRPLVADRLRRRAARIRTTHEDTLGHHHLGGSGGTGRGGRSATLNMVDLESDALVTISSKGTIESLNHHALAMFGLLRNKSKVLSQEFGPTLLSSPFDTWQSAILSAASQTPEPVALPLIARRRDGSTFPVSLSVTRVLLGGASGSRGPVGTMASSRHTWADPESPTPLPFSGLVTPDRHLAQYVAVFKPQTGDHPMFHVDGRGIILAANDSMASVLGMPLDTVVDNALGAFLVSSPGEHGDGSAGLSHLLSYLQELGRGTRDFDPMLCYARVVRSRNTVTIPVVVSASHALGQGGSSPSSVAVVRAMPASRTPLRIVTSPQGIIMACPDSTARSFFGRSEVQLLGRPLSEILQIEDPSSTLASIATATRFRASSIESTTPHASHPRSVRQSILGQRKLVRSVYAAAKSSFSPLYQEEASPGDDDDDDQSNADDVPIVPSPSGHSGKGVALLETVPHPVTQASVILACVTSVADQEENPTTPSFTIWGIPLSFSRSQPRAHANPLGDVASGAAPGPQPGPKPFPAPQRRMESLTNMTTGTASGSTATSGDRILELEASSSARGVPRQTQRRRRVQHRMSHSAELAAAQAAHRKKSANMVTRLGRRMAAIMLFIMILAGIYFAAASVLASQSRPLPFRAQKAGLRAQEVSHVVSATESLYVLERLLKITNSSLDLNFAPLESIVPFQDDIAQLVFESPVPLSQDPTFLNKVVERIVDAVNSLLYYHSLLTDTSGIYDAGSKLERLHFGEPSVALNHFRGVHFAMADFPTAIDQVTTFYEYQNLDDAIREFAAFALAYAGSVQERIGVNVTVTSSYFPSDHVLSRQDSADAAVFVLWNGRNALLQAIQYGAQLENQVVDASLIRALIIICCLVAIMILMHVLTIVFIIRPAVRKVTRTRRETIFLFLSIPKTAVATLSRSARSIVASLTKASKTSKDDNQGGQGGHSDHGDHGGQGGHSDHGDHGHDHRVNESEGTLDHQLPRSPHSPTTPLPPFAPLAASTARNHHVQFGQTGGQTGGQTSGQTSGQTGGQTGSAPYSCSSSISSSTSADPSFNSSSTSSSSSSSTSSLSGDLTDYEEEEEELDDSASDSASQATEGATSKYDATTHATATTKDPRTRVVGFKQGALLEETAPEEKDESSCGSNSASSDSSASSRESTNANPQKPTTKESSAPSSSSSSSSSPNERDEVMANIERDVVDRRQVWVTVGMVFLIFVLALSLVAVIELQYLSFIASLTSKSADRMPANENIRGFALRLMLSEHPAMTNFSRAVFPVFELDWDALDAAANPPSSVRFKIDPSTLNSTMEDLLSASITEIEEVQQYLRLQDATPFSIPSQDSLNAVGACLRKPPATCRDPSDPLYSATSEGLDHLLSAYMVNARSLLRLPGKDRTPDDPAMVFIARLFDTEIRDGLATSTTRFVESRNELWERLPLVALIVQLVAFAGFFIVAILPLLRLLKLQSRRTAFMMDLIPPQVVHSVDSISKFFKIDQHIM